MNSLHESLKQSLNELEAFIPIIDKAIASMHEKIERYKSYRTLWRAHLKDYMD